MPKRYPPWVITNMVAYLQFKLSHQYPNLIFDNGNDSYRVDLGDSYPRLYLNASNDCTLSEKIPCSLGSNVRIEMEVLLRDRDKQTGRFLITLAIKSYQNFNLVINSLQQTTCDYLNNLTGLDCAASTMQKWIPVWSNGNNIFPDKYVQHVKRNDPINTSPDSYASYYARGYETNANPDNSARHLDRDDGNNISFDNYNYVSYHDKDDGNNVNPDNNASCDEEDNGSADFNNIKDPYLSITQQPKPLHVETAKQEKKRKSNIIKDIKNIWALLSNTTYSGANIPATNSKLGGVFFAQERPLKIIWIKYDFNKILEYMLSLGKQVQQGESVDSILSIHSSSAEFDASVRSKSKRAKPEFKADPVKKSTMPSVPPPRPFLYLSPTPDGSIDKLDTSAKSAPAIDELNKGNPARDSSKQVKNPKRRREDEHHVTDDATQIPVPLPPTHRSDLAIPIPVLLPQEKKSDLAAPIPDLLSAPHKSSVTLFGHTPTNPPIKPPAPLPLAKPSTPTTNSKQNLKAVALAKSKAPQIKQQSAAAKPKAAINPPPPIAKPKIPKKETHSLIAQLAEKVLTPPPPTAKPVATQTKPAASSKPSSTQPQAFSVAKAKPLKSAIKKAAPSSANKAVKFSDAAPPLPAKSFGQTLALIDDLITTGKQKKAAAAAETAAKQAAKNTERGQIDVDLEKSTPAATDKSGPSTRGLRK